MSDIIKKTLDSLLNKEIEAIKDKDNIWEEKPVTPKVFFDEWLKQPLFPEQLKAVESIFDKDLKWSRKYYKYLLYWGEGCISGREKIKCVKTGKKNMVSYWAKHDIKPYIKTYNHQLDKIEIDRIGDIIPVGKKKVYEIELETGYKIRVSESHGFFTKAGSYKLLKDLKPGDEIACDKYINKTTWDKGNIPWNKNRTMTLVERLKLSLKMRGKRKNRRRHKRREFILAREIILRRDSQVCKLCNMKKKKQELHIHHINYSPNDNSYMNLITLCNSCHSKTNGIGKNRERWKLRLSNLLKLKL